MLISKLEVAPSVQPPSSEGLSHHCSSPPPLLVPVSLKVIFRALKLCV